MASSTALEGYIDNNLDGIFGTVYLFTDPGAIDQINDEVENQDTARLGCLGECYLPDEQVNLFITDTGSVLEGTMNVTLAEVDSFYLYATFGIGAAGGGTATSLGSLDVSIDDITGLESLSAENVVIPLPAASWLALLLLGGLSVTKAFKRRRWA